MIPTGKDGTEDAGGYDGRLLGMISVANGVKIAKYRPLDAEGQKGLLCRGSRKIKIQKRPCTSHKDRNVGVCWTFWFATCQS